LQLVFIVCYLFLNTGKSIIGYNLVENESTITPKKRKANNTTTEEDINVRPSAALNGSKNTKRGSAPATTSSKKRGRYPKVSSSFIVSDQEKSKLENHKNLLLNAITRICDVESKALLDYFSQNTSNSVVTPLLNVISQLPGAVRQHCADSALFKPEISRVDQSNIRVLNAKLHACQSMEHDLIELSNETRQRDKQVTVDIQKHLEQVA
jgi:hypothetical protein